MKILLAIFLFSNLAHAQVGDCAFFGSEILKGFRSSTENTEILLSRRIELDRHGYRQIGNMVYTTGEIVNDETMIPLKNFMEKDISHFSRSIIHTIDSEKDLRLDHFIQAHNECVVNENKIKISCSNELTKFNKYIEDYKADKKNIYGTFYSYIDLFDKGYLELLNSYNNKTLVSEDFGDRLLSKYNNAKNELPEIENHHNRLIRQNEKTIIDYIECVIKLK